MGVNQENTKLSVMIAQKIKEMIIQQNMKPGTKLPNETQMAQWFQVSRTTIREAMKMLKAQNIVQIRQGDGTYVSDNTGMSEDPLGLRYIEKEALTDGVFEARLLMEPQIAMLAAQRATEEEIREMGEIVSKMKQTNYLSPERMELDIQFHNLIAKSSKNPVFNQLMPAIYETIEKGFVFLLESEDSHKKAQHMHEEIYNAFVDRDVFRVKSAVFTHIYSAFDEIRFLNKEGNK